MPQHTSSNRSSPMWKSW